MNLYKYVSDEINKKLGFEAKLEEYDFDGLYQFVIKVDNEN